MSKPALFSSSLMIAALACVLGIGFIGMTGCGGSDTGVKIPEKKKKRGIPEGYERGNTIGIAGNENNRDAEEPEIIEPDQADNSDAESSRPPVASGTTTSSVSSSEGGLANGLFPQMGLSFAQTGFGGGLVPDYSSQASDPPESDTGRNGRNGRGRTIGPAGGGSGALAGGPDDRERGRGQAEGRGRGRGRTIGPAGGRPGGFDNSNDVDPEDLPPGLMGDAVSAFMDGEESEAFKYLYGHMLTDDKAADQFSLKWYPGLSEPKVALRIGVAVQYASPRNFEGKPPVVGDPEDVKLPGANTRRGGGSSRGRSGGGIGVGGGGGQVGGVGSDDSPYAKVDTSTPEGFLMYYTGDFGDRLLSRLDSRRMHNDAYYGGILKEVAETIGAPSGDRVSRASGNGDAVDPNPDQSGSLGPGVMLLGLGKKQQLIDRARENGLDVLLLFSVRVSSGRTPTSTSNLKAFNVRKEEAEEIFASRSLKSDTVAKKRASGVGEKSDPVAIALDAVFKEVFDQKFRAKAMPALKPKHVVSRIKSLLKNNNADPLATAVEIVSFNRMGLLEADLAMKALDKVLGAGMGSTVLTGTADERLSALDEFLPSVDSGDNDEFR